MTNELEKIIRSRLGKETNEYTIKVLVSDLSKLIQLEKRKSFEEGYIRVLTKGK